MLQMVISVKYPLVMEVSQVKKVFSCQQFVNNSSYYSKVLMKIVSLETPSIK